MPWPSQSPGEKPSLKSSLSSYLAARAELAAIEAQEAAKWAGTQAKLGGTGAFLLIFFYITFLAALIGILGGLLSQALPQEGALAAIGGWPWIALGIALIHGIIAVILLKKAAKNKADRLFFHTRAELQKDKTWMQD